MNNYKFALVGHGGCHNRGCEAILRTTASLLTSEFGEVSFVVPTLNYAYDLYLQPPIGRMKFVPAHPRRFEPVLLPGKIRRRVYKMVKPSFVDRWQDNETVYLRHLFRRCDAVLSVGGDTYSGDYNYPKYYIKVLEIAKSLGKKTVIWGASMGPFRDIGLKKDMQQFLQGVNLITVRESESLKYLQSLGISENVRIVADPAFTLVPIATDRVNTIIAPRPKSLLGINVSGLIASEKTPQARAHVRNSFVSFIEHFVDKVNANILLIAHDIDERFPDDPKHNDYVVMQEILGKITRSDRVSMAPADIAAQETKSLISACDYFIGAKTHAIIAALSSFVPTISLAYSTKTVGINLDLFGHTDYVIPQSDLSVETLWQAWERLVKDHILIRETLACRIPEIQKLAVAGTYYLSEILEDTRLSQ